MRVPEEKAAKEAKKPRRPASADKKLSRKSSCATCKRTFERKDVYKMHSKAGHGNCPLVCPHCNKLCANTTSKISLHFKFFLKGAV
jgi:hypothetical protein